MSVDSVTTAAATSVLIKLSVSYEPYKGMRPCFSALAWFERFGLQDLCSPPGCGRRPGRCQQRIRVEGSVRLWRSTTWASRPAGRPVSLSPKMLNGKHHVRVRHLLPPKPAAADGGNVGLLGFGTPPRRKPNVCPAVGTCLLNPVDALCGADWQSRAGCQPAQGRGSRIVDVIARTPAVPWRA
jgi:hypothetical protein